MLTSLFRRLASLFAAIALALVLLSLMSLVGRQAPLHAGECMPPLVLGPQGCMPPPPPPNPGELIVTKVVVGGPAQPSDFGFTMTLGGVPLTGEQHPGPGSSTTFVITFNATVTVEETTTQPNYLVDDSDCVNVVVALAQTARCMITNTYDPPPPPVVTTLTVAKITVPASATAFAFSSSAGAFWLADGATTTFTVTPGDHFVEEALPPDWDLASISCNGADPGVVTGARVTLVIHAGEDVTCTFRNEMPPPPPPPPNPSLAVQKLTNGMDVDPAAGDVLELETGDDVVWTYIVTNTGDVTLFNVQVVDDAGTPRDPRDDFIALGGASLRPGESVEGSASGLVIEGPYLNTARASGEVLGAVPSGIALAFMQDIVSATDASGYRGITPVPPPPPDPQRTSPNTGSGGVGAPFDTFGWRLTLTGLIAVSGLSFAGGLRLIRRRR